MVRNSVGSGKQLCLHVLTGLGVCYEVFVILFFFFYPLTDCYVADELVVSRAGRRIRVGNTDAEGRMVMVDLLCEMREQVHTYISI